MMRQALQQLSTSFLFAALFVLLTVGGLITALAEKSINQPPTAEITETSIPTSVAQIDFTETPVDSGLAPSPSSIPASPTHTATLAPSTACPAPTGWASYIIQPGDTLDGLARRYGLGTNILKEKNCLVSSELVPDTRLHVPPYPTATPIPCGAPASWTQRYTVLSGDNLYRIGLKYRVSVGQLQQANCLGYSTQIKVGQILKVPNVPTSTPQVTHTLPASQTPSATLTATNAPPSKTPTPVPTTITPSLTPENTASATPVTATATEN
jgi:LysM repeat protein